MTDDTPASARPAPGASTGTIEAERSTPGAVLAVEARGLVKTFGTIRAVDGIDLVVHEGEIFGVLGPNGAGKTTMLQSELLDREIFRTLDAAGDGLTRFATYYNYDRLHGELDWHTPAERFDGTPFTARGFERVPSLHHLQGWLDELMSA